MIILVPELKYFLQKIEAGLKIQFFLELKLLKKQSNHFGVPIVNCFPYHNDDYLVEDLLNACIREIDDVDSNYGKAVNVEVIEDAENIRNKVHYRLKDCRDQGTDFTEIIDFANSDFLKEEL